ncbi:MAG TPA: NUDIX hydrolase [Jatrophihabitans sp.]|nr:NUDIX hydrolase [Jatrophihabitans sp.]
MSEARADVPVRDAATVVLLRDGPRGVETWLLTRVRQMVFAAGMTVFPGGRVDEDDAELPFVGDVTVLASRAGCDQTTARALVGAAVRETFEETGVLLTVPVADLSAARADVELGRVSFGDLLRANGLAVDAEAVRPWSRWVTPAGETRRYDTRFFVAGLPSHAEAQDVTHESSEASWVPVGEAVEQAQRGERRMLPPTITTLASLLPYRKVTEVLASSETRPLDPVRPKVVFGTDRSVSVELPDGTLLPVPPGMFA